MIIIGITGTLGAGKGAVVEYLEQKDFAHFSARAFFTKELECRGISVNRDTMTKLANELRANHGLSYIMQELYKEAAANCSNAVIESIRTPAEAGELISKGHFYLLAVDADPQIRYERITKRGSETDNVSYEKFLADEAREMHNDYPTKQNIAAVIEKAAYQIQNNGSLEELHTHVDHILKEITQKETRAA